MTRNFNLCVTCDEPIRAATSVVYCSAYCLEDAMAIEAAKDRELDYPQDFELEWKYRGEPIWDR